MRQEGQGKELHTIEVQSRKTCYGYPEDYWIIDGISVVEYLEKYVKEGRCPALSMSASMLGLLPAWSGLLLQKWENDFVWELIDSPEELNVPILVCEEDCDLSCIVIVVKIKKTENRVCWERLGYLDRTNWDRDAECNAGILCLESYTEEDWQEYGDNIATESYGIHEYWEWVGTHGYEEPIRRLRNYMKPYMQKEENIQWIKEVTWMFERKQYREMVERYREIAAMHLRET